MTTPSAFPTFRNASRSLAAAIPLLMSIPSLPLFAGPLVDPDATPETVALYNNLSRVAGQHVLFGAQDTLAYGYSWIGEPDRSDVKDVTGAFPALYGWDLHNVGLPEPETAPDPAAGFNKITPEKLVRWVREGHSRGGVITFSWHMPNPVTGGTFYDTTPAVKTILPGGEMHAEFLRRLDAAAAFFKELEPIPVIFRPWHEHNGDWFWWCKGSTDEADYIALWRFTVEYLRDTKDVHNLLYAISPDRSRMDLADGTDAFLWAYPGDAYVDIFGLDDYWDAGHSANEAEEEQRHGEFVKSLELLVQVAREHGKLPALTETGSDKLKNPQWWTGVLLKALDANETTRQVAYVQVWRNANRELEGRDHFYVPPHLEHPSAADFIQFRQSSLILFEDELPDMYAGAKTEDGCCGQ